MAPKLRYEAIKPTMKTFAFLFFALMAVTMHGQDAYLQDRIDSLAKIGRMVLEHPESAVRDSMNRKFRQRLKQIVQTEKGYKASLSEVTNMSALSGENFRIFTWQVPDKNYHYTRYGLVAAERRRGIRLTELKDQKSNIPRVDFRRLRSDEWLGALYYQIIPLKDKRKKVYTLLGYASGPEINKKVVEIIEVRNNGTVKFGDKRFYVDQFNDQTYKSAPMRLILRYSSQYTASVRWHPDEDLIIMDHCAPPRDELKGAYSYYGPDFSYNGLYWKDGWWHLEENPEFNTGQNNPIVPPNRPLGLPPSQANEN